MSLSDVGNIADLNNNGTVDLVDFGIFGDKWQIDSLLLVEDINRNGYVDIEDLALFCSNWLWIE